MKVVLVKTMPDLGVIGDTKDVKPGFARNFLFRRKLAVLPTDPRAKSYRAARAVAREELLKGRALVTELAKKWTGQTLKITARAGEDGTLYGSVGAKELMKLLGRDDVAVEAPVLKTLGTHAVNLSLPHGVSVPVTVVIVAEK
jgi:large subunit ribosomal protein L9